MRDATVSLCHASPVLRAGDRRRERPSPLSPRKLSAAKPASEGGDHGPPTFLADPWVWGKTRLNHKGFGLTEHKSRGTPDRPPWINHVPSVSFPSLL